MFITPPDDDNEPEQWTKAEIYIALVIVGIVVFLIAQMFRSWA